MCSWGEDRYRGSHPLLLLFPCLCPAARLLPPPALPAAGLMLPITKLLAEVGIVFGGGRSPRVRCREQPSGSAGRAVGSGRVSPGVQPPIAPQPAVLEVFRVQPLGTQVRPWSSSVAGRMAALSPFSFNMQKIHWRRPCAESSRKTLAFPFLALLACLLINKRSSSRERRLRLRAALLRFQLKQNLLSIARPQPTASSVSSLHWPPKCSQLAITHKLTYLLLQQ